MIKNLKIPPELKGLKLADRLQSENLDLDIIIVNVYYDYYCQYTMKVMIVLQFWLSKNDNVVSDPNGALATFKGWCIFAWKTSCDILRPNGTSTIL